MLHDRAELTEAFDRMLATAGRVTLTEWLIELGRLAPGDVGRWRAGGADRLVDLLFGDPIAIGREVTLARELARGRKLTIDRVPATVDAGHLPGAPGDWARLVFEPARTAPQLDLFADSADASRAHRLREAIAEHRREAAEAALSVLERHDPGHPLAAAAPGLIDRIGWVPGAEADDWQAVTRLRDQAEAALERSAATYLRPFWTAVARNAQTSPAPYQHPSAAWIQIPDWDAALASLGPDPDRLASPELLARGVVALENTADHRAALAWYFTLCWRFPEIVEVLESLAEILNLDAALDAWDDQELAESLGWQLFPEWLTLGRWVPADGALVSAHRPAAYDAVCEVVNDPASVDARRTLQVRSPGLFAAFMARR